MNFRLALTGTATLVFLLGFFLLGRWTFILYYGDSSHYYLHVVSALVNQDVGDYDRTITTLQEVNPGSGDPREDKFGIRLTERGRRYIKYTLGVPVMEAPFFALTHLVAHLHPDYEANGWTRPYLLVVSLSTICYLALGLYLLIGVLERYFSRRVIVLSILALVLATNLFYHATYVTMAHGFLFFDYCLLIWLSDRFYRKPGRRRALAIGAVVGLITLTRVPELISLLIPLLWGVFSMESLKERIRFFAQRPLLLGWAALGLGLAFSPQIAYWYYVSGQLVFNPYDGEGFNFLNPKIYEGFFHFKNGWLLYSPVMFFSLVGLYFLPRYARGLLLPILAFVGLHVFIHYSYYAWTYFPGLGQRPMVETYPVLVFGLAAFFSFCLKKPIRRWIPYVLLLLFAPLNLFQTWQMDKGLIWSERHNAAFYWATFLQTKGSLATLRAYDTKELQPDSSRLERLDILLQENFEDTTRWENPSTPAYAGQYALLSDRPFTTLFEDRQFPETRPGDWLRVEIQAYVRAADMVYHRDQCQSIMLELYDPEGKRRKQRSLKLTPQIGNPKHSIWTTGRPDTWGEAAYFVRLPRRWTPYWTLKCYLINQGGQRILVDELQIEHYRREK